MPHPDPVDIVASLGGIARVVDVRRRGASKDSIRRAVARGRLRRPRYGVVALNGLPAAILRAAGAGGALAGLSAAEYYGLWTPQYSRLSVSVRGDAVRAHDPDVHLIRDGHLLTDTERFVVSLTACLAQCIRLLPFDEAVAVLDSALRAHPERVDVDQIRSRIPARFRSVLDAADPRSEAGAESLARVRLARLGILAHPQVWITRSIRVDLLVGDRLVIEIGSIEFHANPDQYEADHERATTLLTLGCEVLEFTTNQVMDDWDTVADVIARRATQQRSKVAAPTLESTRRPNSDDRC